MNWKEIVEELLNMYRAIDNVNSHAGGVLASAASELACARNELCLQCGQYKNSHLGACDGCRWREGK